MPAVLEVSNKQKYQINEEQDREKILPRRNESKIKNGESESDSRKMCMGNLTVN